MAGAHSFFAIAAQMMRRILVDAGGDAIKVGLDTIAVLSPAPDRSILVLDDALTTFSELAPRRAKVVELRYFGVLTEDELFVALGNSERTLRRDWGFAKA